MSNYGGINNFVHLVINVGDLIQAHKFYSSLFNWSFSDLNSNSNQILFQVSQKGDFMSGTINLIEDHIEIKNDTLFLYIYVDDIMTAVNKIVELGGKIIDEIFTLGEIPGKLATFYDPFGNKFGLWSDN